MSHRGQVFCLDFIVHNSRTNYNHSFKTLVNLILLVCI